MSAGKPFLGISTGFQNSSLKLNSHAVAYEKQQNKTSDVSLILFLLGKGFVCEDKNNQINSLLLNKIKVSSRWFLSAFKILSWHDGK